jgi:hypothetical protein
MAFQNFRFDGAAYFEVGTGLLPFSITRGDATSKISWSMLEADRIRANAFDLDGDPENGTIATGNARALRNLSGYLPQTWIEDCTQVQSYCGLLAVLLYTTLMIFIEQYIITKKDRSSFNHV